MLTLSRKAVRRLAVARAGLGRPERTGLSRRAAGTGKRARTAACAVVDRFGYLQLDSVCVTGARTHSLVLMSRLGGATPALGESLLQPGTPLFEYWGHEACWLPMELYPHMEFRRRDFAVHPWWGDLLGEHPEIATEIIERLHEEGPLRASDFHSARPGTGMWDLSVAKKVLSALWSRGDVAVRQRLGFQREFDLAERVIPDRVRARSVSRAEAIRTLVLRALSGHGWATRGTIAATWRFRNMRQEVLDALSALESAGEILPACAQLADRSVAGWIRPADAELAGELESCRPRQDRGVLVSPFDPLIWDRARTEQLFGFRQAIEIYKPAAQREFGYYCLPILAGDRFIGRVDLKADRKAGVLLNRANHWEAARPEARHRVAAEGAVARLAEGLELQAPTLN